MTDQSAKTIHEKTKVKVLSPTVWKLGFISFFADISSEMLYPITPFFLTTVLGASMASVGVVEGVAEAIASLMKTYSGLWSDKTTKRKPFILFGYLLAAIGKPLMGLSSTWFQVLLARGLDRTGKGLRTAPRDALLADSVSEKSRGAAFGLHRGMDTLGAVLGPLLAILYLSLEKNNLRNIYFWALIPGLISVGIAFLIVEGKAAPKKHPAGFKIWDFGSFSGPFKKYLFSWALFSVTNSSDIFLLMKAKSSGISTIEMILMYCGYNLTYAFFSPYLGDLSDRMGRKKILIFGLCIFAVVYAGFSMATTKWQFWLLFGVYGLYMAATDGVGKALAVDLLGPRQKATGLGALGTVTGLATIVASTSAGYMWDHYGSSSAFILGACGAFLAAIFLLRVEVKTYE